MSVIFAHSEHGLIEITTEDAMFVVACRQSLTGRRSEHSAGKSESGCG